MVIKLFDRHSIFVCVCLLAAAIAVSMALNIENRKGGAISAVSSQAAPSAFQPNIGTASAEAQSIPEPDTAPAAASVPTEEVKAPANEMRAVWVPYMSLDMSKSDDKSEAAFQKKFDAIVSGAKNCGMNTLIVQVRPFGDALYKSAYYPWSHVVGGTQGVNPGYDPLAVMAASAHKAGMKLHAWVNPLRIQTSATPSILAQGNYYNTWKSDPSKAGWTVDCPNGKYYNPAYPQVRRLIADGAKEIAKNYDVDGIQFDDYFYPTQDASFDKSAYDAYCAGASKSGTPVGLLEWRRGNINALVSLVYSEIKTVKPNLPFGIAPQGNVQNDKNMGADVVSWCSARGYVDYICPQLYVNFENPVLPFDTAAQSWRKLVVNTNVKLYLGLAVYKSGSDADSGTWKKSNNILARQVETGRKASCDGFMFYSWDYLNTDQTKEEVQNVMKVLK